MKTTIFRLLTAATVLFFVSCSDDETPVIPDPQGTYDLGYFVLNEGNFGQANATVDFVGEDGQLRDNIFEQVNNIGLGDVAQSLTFHNNRAYVVVNNSNAIEVVGRYDFRHEATIADLMNNPRYLVVDGNMAYVSNWGNPGNPEDDYIAVIDLMDNEVEALISVGEGPEKMAVANGKLYVAQQGGWGHGNTITVIDLDEEEIMETIEVADVPNSLVVHGGYLYVLSGGKPEWTGELTQGALSRINLSNHEVEETFSFNTGRHPQNLTLEDGQLYYTLNASVFQMNPVAGQLPETPLLSVGSQGVYGIYGFAVHQGNIYIADAKNYNSEGEVYVFSSVGQLLENHTVGLVPNGFYFND